MISWVYARHGPSLDGSVEAFAFFGVVRELSFEKFAPVASIVSQLGRCRDCLADAVSEGVI